MMRGRLRCLTCSLIFFALGVAGSARAQTPQSVSPATSNVEVFAGYSYMGTRIATDPGTSVNLNGGTISAAFYLKRWLYLVGDFGIYHQGDVARSGRNITMSTYQFGPRIRFRSRAHLTPFVQVIAGVGHAGGTLFTDSLGPGIAPVGSNTRFAFTAGGGADWKINRRIAIRLVQAEYSYSQLLNGSGGGNNQGDIRLSAGIVFTISDNN